MTNSKTTLFEKLVYIAYGFYILVAAMWVVMSLFYGHYFNYYAAFAIVVFSTQAYYRHKLTNLLAGIVIFFLSIISLLEFLSMGLRDKAGFDPFVAVMVGVSVTSIIMAGILIFSYLKLSFKDQ